ncbi:aspartate kinase [Candidatus Marinamargulisbacteria bacterium SCGC AG-439-L15]|nr:aspartate kinase [Candidatus Marinamargulisbacteria bacterium SCGC AG-439-L15]
MSIIVQKFGGTSLGSIDRIQAVAKHIKTIKNDHNKVVVVVSAMGKSTDKLVDMAHTVSNGKPDAREYDALVSTGENVSAALLSMTLIANGTQAISLSGHQAGVETESVHSKAKIKTIKPDRVMAELNQNKVVIVTGFQGMSEHQNITTIGRGGSDTSAVALAASLNADECDIYTDVDGIYTTNPRIEEKAVKLDEISYDEMLELASLGSEVLHPRAVECAKENKICLHVRSSFTLTEGTRVKESSGMESNKPVTGVALKKNEARLSILGVPDKPNIAGTVFSKLSEQHINVDMIIQSTEQNGVNNITFTVSREEFEPAKAILSEVVKDIGATGIRGDKNIAKVSAVGVGMISKSGVAAKIFDALGEEGINIELISTSEIKVSCAVKEADGEAALKALHAAFDLDKQ